MVFRILRRRTESRRAIFANENSAKLVGFVGCSCDLRGKMTRARSSCVSDEDVMSIFKQYDQEVRCSMSKEWNAGGSGV